MMDSQISKCRGKTMEITDEDDFKKWEPEDDEPEDLECMTQSNGNTHWSVSEMFRANKGLCTDSDFASDLSQYQTTTVIATNEDRQRANEIAKQIENDSMSKHNARLENDDEERNLDTKTRFAEDTSSQSSWRSQPNRSGTNPGSGRSTYRDRGDRDKDRRFKQPHTLRSRPSTTNVVTTTSTSNVHVRTSSTTSSPVARSGGNSSGGSATPVNAPITTTATAPTQQQTVITSAQSISAPSVTLTKEAAPKVVDSPVPPTTTTQPQQPQRNTSQGSSTTTQSKFKFNPDAPAFIPSVKKEITMALSPSVTPITTANNNNGGAVFVMGSAAMGPSMPGLAPHSMPMQFVPIQSYPPPGNYVYANMMPAGVPIVSSGLMQNPQPANFQQQQAQLIQHSVPQSYPQPTNYAYKNMPPSGIPPQIIASSGPSAGMIAQNHQQAAFQQQQPQILQPTNHQSYPPPRSYLYTNIISGGLPPQMLASGPAANMIVPNAPPAPFQQQPQIMQAQASHLIRKSAPYGYADEGRQLS